MKIVFLFPHFLSPGGAANVVLQFARALQSRGYQVEICCAKISKEYRQANLDLHFRELKIPASNSIVYWLFFPFWQLKINRRLKAYNNCILFPHVLPSNWWAWTYKKRYKDAKIVWYCHEPSAFIHSTTWINAIPVKLMKWGAKLLNPFLKSRDIILEKENDVVICNSYFTKEQYKRIYGRVANEVIYPPANVKKVLPELNKENNILTVGRLSRFKNVDVLIKSFRTLLPDWPGGKLIIVGEGEEKNSLEQLAVHLGLTERVCFKGKVNDEQLAGLYQKSKLTVICSHDEPFGLVPLESMMHSTPVVAHNSGGPTETVHHNVNGFLYNDENELIQFIKRVIEMDNDEYFQMQQAYLKEVVKYDISISILQLESILQKLGRQ